MKTCSAALNTLPVSVTGSGGLWVGEPKNYGRALCDARYYIMSIGGARTQTLNKELELVREQIPTDTKA